MTRRHRIVHAAGGDAAAVAVVVLKQAALVSFRVDARVHLGMRRHGEELHGGGGGGRREEERGEEEEDGADVWRWGHDDDQRSARALTEVTDTTRGYDRLRWRYDTGKERVYDTGDTVHS